MDYAQFISEGNMIIVVALYGLGMLFKASALKDRLIPLLLFAVSIAVCLVRSGLNMDAVLQGLICASLAVFGNQLYKQTTKE